MTYLGPTSTVGLYISVYIATVTFCLRLEVVGFNGGRDRTRTCDLLRVKQAL